MYPHRIRLRGPWRCEPARRPDGSTENLPPAATLNVPHRWRTGELQAFRGVIRCVRKFGYPGRIDPFERVWLVVEGAGDQPSFGLILNARPLHHS